MRKKRANARLTSTSTMIFMIIILEHVTIFKLQAALISAYWNYNDFAYYCKLPCIRF